MGERTPWKGSKVDSSKIQEIDTVLIDKVAAVAKTLKLVPYKGYYLFNYPPYSTGSYWMMIEHVAKEEDVFIVGTIW